MKNDQPKVINLPLICKDELNLIECPFACLTATPEQRPDKLEFIDKQNKITRHWKILGSREYGLPCSLDESVYIAMLCLTKRQGLVGRKIPFSQYEILKLMGWQVNGERYNRLGLALKRLSSVTIETNYLWDRGKFRKGAFLFHIIEEAFIDKSRKNSQGSYFVWSETVFESLLHGNIKNLDLETYFSLTTAISRRFFRLMDKRLHKSGRASFDLKELCHEKLGISRNMIYPSELKRKLGPTLREHKAKKLLSSATYTKTRAGNWLLNIRNCKENPEPITAPLPNPSALSETAEAPKADSIFEKLLLMKITAKRATVLLQTYSRELIEGWLMAVDAMKPAPKSKAGCLITALKEGWNLPESEVIKEKAAEGREKQLRAEYDKYILAKIDEYIRSIDPGQIEEELKAHENIFYAKYPHYEEFRGGEGIKPYIRHNYKMEKAKILNLPSFDEWKF